MQRIGRGLEGVGKVRRWIDPKWAAVKGGKGGEGSRW